MRIFTFFFLIALSLNGYANSALKQKYPHGLLTEDYGILDDNDLEADAKNNKPYPYDINKFQPAYMRWQCFPTKNTKFTYDKWKGNDPWGSETKIVEMCAYSFYAQDGNISHSYSGRRAFYIEKIGLGISLKQKKAAIIIFKVDAFKCRWFVQDLKWRKRQESNLRPLDS